ncbi:MAG TPA: YceH family protein [Acidimicrobiales bacterium]
MLAIVVELSPVEARVIGSLAEKQLTTPQQYPLTLNALVVACNQTSNRDPVVVYDDGIAETALSSLREAGLVRLVHPSHGRSATRYRQVLDERFGLDARGLSILAVLLLRGPQTIGELRARTERMADFGSLDDVGRELERLADGTDPLVRQLSRRPGQKEERWTQLLAVEPLEADAPSDASIEESDAAVAMRSVSLDDVVISLRADVDALREEVQRISAIVEELRGVFEP